jgi:hypothetical protein
MTGNPPAWACGSGTGAQGAGTGIARERAAPVAGCLDSWAGSGRLFPVPGDARDTVPRIRPCAASPRGV